MQKMAFVLSCPNCGATVDVSDNEPIAVCASCGKRSFFNELVPKRLEVTIKDPSAPNVDKLVQTALNLWLIDDGTAINYVNQAMPMAPEDLRIWILKSLIEKSDVSNVIGNARMDPNRDLDFCLKVINKEPSVMKMVRGRMDHPLIQAVADVESAMQYLDKGGNVFATIYDDELDTGYERVRKEFHDLADRLRGDAEVIGSNPQLSTYAAWMRSVGIVEKIQAMDRALSEPTSDHQTTFIVYMGKILLGKIIHYTDTRITEQRVKKDIFQIDLECGKHAFKDGSYSGTTVLFIPRMPNGMISSVSVGPNMGSTLIHTYMLDDGLFLNVDTRRHELPFLFIDGTVRQMSDVNAGFFDRFYL